MTDHDTASSLVDQDGELTELGRTQVRGWCREAELEVDRITRHWVAAVAVVDVVGLPIALWVAPWPWLAVVATWLAGIALALVLACQRHERACQVRLRRIERRVDAARRAVVDTIEAPRPAQAPRLRTGRRLRLPTRQVA